MFTITNIIPNVSVNVYNLYEPVFENSLKHCAGLQNNDKLLKDNITSFVVWNKL